MATISENRPAPADTSKPDIGISHPYTCNTCQVAFRNSDLQKSHMRSDWQYVFTVIASAHSSHHFRKLIVSL